MYYGNFVTAILQCFYKNMYLPIVLCCDMKIHCLYTNKISQGERSWYVVTVFAINRYRGTSRCRLKTVSALALTKHRKQPVMGTFSVGFFDGYRDSMYAYLVVPRETAGNGTAFFPAI